jgi:hypothetical protein
MFKVGYVSITCILHCHFLQTLSISLLFLFLFIFNCVCQMCSSILQLVLHHWIHQTLIHSQGLHLVQNHEVYWMLFMFQGHWFDQLHAVTMEYTNWLKTLMHQPWVLLVLLAPLVQSQNLVLQVLWTKRRPMMHWLLLFKVSLLETTKERKKRQILKGCSNMNGSPISLGWACGGSYKEYMVHYKVCSLVEGKEKLLNLKLDGL